MTRIGLIIQSVLAALIFLPNFRDWGSRLSRAGWCRAGVAATVVYIAAAGVAHHVALDRVKQFALLEHLVLIAQDQRLLDHAVAQLADLLILLKQPLFGALLPGDIDDGDDGVFAQD